MRGGSCITSEMIPHVKPLGSRLCTVRVAIAKEDPGTVGGKASVTASPLL